MADVTVAKANDGELKLQRTRDLYNIHCLLLYELCNDQLLCKLFVANLERYG